MSQNLLYVAPQLAHWLTRAATHGYAVSRFMANPLLFAQWYALIESRIAWPVAAAEIQAAERAKKLSLDRTLSLLAKVGGAVSGGHADIGYFRLLLEGFAVADWAFQEIGTFQRIVKEAEATFTAPGGTFPLNPDDNPFVAKIAALSAALALTRVESDVLHMAVLSTVSPELRSFCEQLIGAQSGSRRMADVWTAMFACTEADLVGALSPRAALRLSGLLLVSAHKDVPTVSRFWAETLLNPSGTLMDAVLERLKPRPGAGIPARLSAEDQDLAKNILVNARDPGVNLLLYGADGLETRAALRDIAVAAEKLPYRLLDAEIPSAELPTLAYVAQRVLHAEHPRSAVLVIDRTLDVLEQRLSPFLREILGIAVDSSRIGKLDEALLQDTPIPTIWVGASASALPEEAVARFVFHAKLQKARRAERKVQMLELLSSLKLTKRATDAVLALEEVSALQLEVALKASKLYGGKSRKEREAALLQALTRSLGALRRSTTSVAKECVTQYSLEYLNCAGKFGPNQIMTALSHRPSGSLCLYGIPGTGKTQFVEYLASALGIRLITKRASDLLSKYVGENEKNIAAMFAEAEAEEAMLFLDEGDSFLRDRSLASQEWEVTKVNELLQHMERFKGIFVVATNLFRGLDMAALRRFTFKLEFCALSETQRWAMFCNEAVVDAKSLPRELRDTWQLDLALLPNLTAGDFATVKRQCLLMGETLTPTEWLGQLSIECSAKSSADLASTRSSR